MQPFYEDKWVKIFHGDCREIIHTIESVNLTLTDFPYGNDTDYGKYVDTQGNLKELIDSTMPLILSKTNVALIACGIGNMFLYPRPDWVLSWHWEHTNAGSSCWGFNNWQPLLAYGKDPYLTNGMGRRQDARGSVNTGNYQDKKINHPCPKPIEVWEWLIIRGSVSTDDIIFDPFLGSGTTCYCAKKLNRKSIGIEIEEKYCEIAAKRCMQEVMAFDLPTQSTEKQVELSI
jgi:DNA modification methylase